MAVQNKKKNGREHKAKNKEIKKEKHDMNEDTQTAAITEEEVKSEARAPEEAEAPDASNEREQEPPAEEETPEESQDDKLAEALAQRDEYLSLAQRVQADFENFRRRNNAVRHDAFEDGARTFATTLLPVIDNLERAIAAAKDTADPNLKEGIEMVLRQMNDAFQKRGITTIERKGEMFDPNLENAVLQGTPEDGQPGQVCEVLQKGYRMNGTVMRYAMVKVVPQ